jgi:hypothetical protein
MTGIGSLAPAAAQFAVPGEAPRELQFGCQAVLDGRAVIKRLARELPGPAADLIEIAASVSAVDRLVRRPGQRELSGGSTWARKLWLRVPAAPYRKSPADSPAIHAMQWQVARLHACLNKIDPWPSLVSQYPDVLDTAPLTQEQVINLYCSYVQEWDSLRGRPGIGGQLWRGRTAAL